MSTEIKTLDGWYEFVNFTGKESTHHCSISSKLHTGNLPTKKLFKKWWQFIQQ